MILVTRRKTVIKAATASTLLLALIGIPSLAQTPSTTPSTSPEAAPEMPMMFPGQMQQQMMGQMGQLHILIGEIQQRMAQMTPEQMQEFRPLMMEHHQKMVEQMQQLIDAMPQVEGQDVTESNGEPDMVNSDSL
ncbi:MAG: hypothetical protein AAFW84_15785 [Cyanobacteria bacterium J06635_15]